MTQTIMMNTDKTNNKKISKESYLIIRISVICVLSFFSSSASFAQDPQFSQFYANPLWVNPALTGNTEQLRFVGNYRNQWSAVPGAFVSYSASADYNLRKINSGIGVQFVRDKAGQGGLRFTNIAGAYSYQFSITRLSHISAGARAGYTIRDIDYSAFKFGDQYLRQSGSVSPPPTVETFPTDKISYPDFGAGSVYYTKRFWTGISFNHITQPNQSLTGQKTPLPLFYSAHGGYNLRISKDAKGYDITSLTIAANYKAQQKWDQLDLGAYFKREPVIWGMWYRGIPLLKAYKPGYSNNDAIIFLAGLFLKDYGISVGYSYDLTISRLITNTAGSHEISIIYEYSSPEYKRKKHKFIIPCTKF